MLDFVYLHLSVSRSHVPVLHLAAGSYSLMTGEYFSVIWQACQRLVQRLVHHFRIALKESSATGNEKGITCKDCSLALGSVLCIVADTIFGVAWGMKRGNFDVSDLEDFAVVENLGDVLAVFSAEDWDWVCFQLEEVSGTPWLEGKDVRYLRFLQRDHSGWKSLALKFIEGGLVPTDGY